MGKTILIAGGSGLVGTRLKDILRQNGYDVRLLTRTPRQANHFAWNPAKGEIDEAALEGVSAIVNLAGAGIADKPWTKARKKELIDSRVQSAEVLAKALKNASQKPEVYVSASAIGYYGNSGERRMQETDTPVDQSFMVECCAFWESAADAVADTGIRTVKLRIGVVMAKEGGALAEVLKPLRFGLGTYFADGRAWWSWIHLDDLCQMIRWSIEQRAVAGTFNAVAPYPVRGKTLVEQAAQAWHKRAVFLPAPAFALRLALGEMSAVVLNSNLISADKVVEAGFKFQFPEIGPALSHILAPKKP